MAGNTNGKTDYDVIIIGGGPGGYVAAIRAGQLGLKAACVEADKLGGVCLNIGCIPTKALLSSALLVSELKDAGGHGISFDGFTADLGPAQKRSRKVASRLSNGVSFLLKKNKVDHIEGYGRLLGGGAVEVEKDGEKRRITAGDIIIATGSRPRSLPFLQIDEERIWSSTGALFQEKAPETLVVVGAGAVGMEFADIYNAYGTRVTVIEALDRVLPLEDKDSSRAVAQAFKRRKMDIFTSARVESTVARDDGVTISFTDKRGEGAHPRRRLRAVGGGAHSQHRGHRSRGGGREADRTRQLHRDRRGRAHERSRRVGGGRLRGQPAPRPQGDARRGGRGRAHRGDRAPHGRLRQRPQLHLLPPRGGVGRAHRGAGARAGPRHRGGQVPVGGERDARWRRGIRRVSSR